MSHILDYLTKVQVFAHGSSIASWDRLSIDHGFTGIDEPEVIDWHHVKQVHGNALIEACSETSESSSEGRPAADAIFTKTPGVALGVKTADCLPLIFWHRDAVMAVHAGWKGLTSGVVLNAFDWFIANKLDLNSLLVAIGPSISGSAFEVGYEVIQAWVDGSESLGDAELHLPITRGSGDRWYFDLGLAAVTQISQYGVPAEAVSWLQSCTLSEPQWHSYRKSGNGAGRNWTWVRASG